MKPLILKRKKIERLIDSDNTVIRVSGEAFNRIAEIAEETGLPIKEVASQMICYAAENVQYAEMGGKADE